LRLEGLHLKKQSLTGHLSNAAAKRILQLHRLLAFEETFSKFLAGRATAEEVKVRARKMLASGLPKLK
jgi:hypothetical protein